MEFIAICIRCSKWPNGLARRNKKTANWTPAPARIATILLGRISASHPRRQAISLTPLLLQACGHLGHERPPGDPARSYDSSQAGSSLLAGVQVGRGRTEVQSYSLSMLEPSKGPLYAWLTRISSRPDQCKQNTFS